VIPTDQNKALLKDNTEVEVKFVDGTVLRGFLYLSSTERIVDVLNDERDYIPFQDTTHNVQIVNKRTIIRVTPIDQAKPRVTIRDKIRRSG